MHHSKLVEALKTLPPRDLRKLEEVMESPYFNKNEEVAILYKTLRHYAPDFKHKDLERTRLFAKAFPKRKYDEKKLGYLMSDILRLLEKYFAYEQLEEQPIQQAYEVLNRYTDLKLEKHYNKTLNDAQKHQQRLPYLNADYFYNEFLLESVNNLYFDRQRKHTFDASLQKAIDNLDLYYLTLKLKYSCEIFNRKNVVAADYELRLLDEILLYVKERDFSNSPAIAIYYQILMTLTDGENETHFKELKQLLTDNATRFPKSEARDMFAYAQNYCIKRVNSGQPKYLAELFQLYKTTLESEVIFADVKYLSPWSYKNITTVALRQQEYEWTQQFINDYQERLAPEFRENAFAFNMASLHFNQHQYEKALEYLRDVEFTDIVYNIDSKAMMLRIYYELEAIEPMYSLLDAFQVYLKRNKLISDYQRKIYLNLIKFSRQLLKIAPGERNKAYVLKEKVQETKQVAYSGWLLEKADGIIGK